MNEEQLMDSSEKGSLQLNVISSIGSIPIKDATVTIRFTGNPDTILATLTTDDSGQTPTVQLPAPPIEYSLSADAERQPYSEYNIQVSAIGYDPILISGSEILSDTTSIQPIILTPIDTIEDTNNVIVIPAHTLFGNYPPKIPEAEVKPIEDSNEVVLSKVVIPEYIIVHDGVPTDSSATNYWVRYTDYIKNVASCEIYATWPESTLYANILAIMSFTLNRVYTEWYRSRGYNFTITSSTAYDQKWIYGRNIYSNISLVVDSIFNNYLSRPGITQPIFTSYCDGKQVSCRGLSQWGSKYLGDQGYTAIEIIRYYYGNDMFINSAVSISGVPSSWPGYNLYIGANGDKVRQLQMQLNRIAVNYPAIPKIVADGIYGPLTAEAVKTFQKVFSLPSTGITDFATWYTISRIFVAVSRISEPS